MPDRRDEPAAAPPAILNGVETRNDRHRADLGLDRGVEHQVDDRLAHARRIHSQERQVGTLWPEPEPLPGRWHRIDHLDGMELGIGDALAPTAATIEG